MKQLIWVASWTYRFVHDLFTLQKEFWCTIIPNWDHHYSNKLYTKRSCTHTIHPLHAIFLFTSFVVFWNLGASCKASSFFLTTLATHHRHTHRYIHRWLDPSNTFRHVSVLNAVLLLPLLKFNESIWNFITSLFFRWDNEWIYIYFTGSKVEAQESGAGS